MPAATCPRCGAPLTGSETLKRVCAFCHTEVAPAQAERVVVREIVERVVLVDTTGRTSLACPRCSAPLFEGRTTMALLHGCGACGGVWLDNAGTRCVLGLVDPQIVALADRASDAAARTASTERRALRCPVGGEELGVAAVGDVELDVCALHGTWFDKNELHRVWALLVDQHRPAYDYGPAAAQAREDEREARAIFGVLGFRD
ncbi:MAG TPA: zf-TFIIB domain-containing protein [Polyangiaceae bacterium]|jgi:Zn-finger nucleic acid-binding protein